MPEGHVAHRAVVQHGRLLAGSRIAAGSPQGRFAEGAAALDGRICEELEAFGKHLLYRFDPPVYLHVHLGLAGRWLLFDGEAPAPMPQVRLRMTSPRGAVDLIAPVKCELWDAAQRSALLDRLGPDPLRGDDPSHTLRRLARSPTAIGAALLDQTLFAGVGNVFRSEALAELRVSPTTPARDLSDAALRQLWTTLRGLMCQAMSDGRILPHVPDGVDPADVDEVQTRWVYKRPACRRCGTAVRWFSLGGRTAYACPHCQRDSRVTGARSGESIAPQAPRRPRSAAARRG